MEPSLRELLRLSIGEFRQLILKNSPFAEIRGGKSEFFVGLGGMAEPVSLTHERVDDIPLLLGLMQRLCLPDLIDRHLGNHGNHQGYSNGWLATLWLSFILSEGNHRKVAVQEWAERHRLTIERFVGSPLRPDVECNDDRLGLLLSKLAEGGVWEALEAELWPTTRAVYHLEMPGVRLDSTTSYGYHTIAEDGLMQLGHSKDHRPDLPQFKLMAAAVEGSGFWLASEVLSGQRADDPLYLPLIARARAILNQLGVLYTGDSKMAALATRADIVAHQDYYLTVLPRTGENKSVIEGAISAVVEGEQVAQLLWGPPGRAGAPARLLGCGYERERSLACEVEGERVEWVERLQVIRSPEMARSTWAALETRLKKATAALWALTPPPGRGKHQIKEEAAIETAIAAVLAKHQVTGLLEVGWRREEETLTQFVGRGRGGKDRPTRTVVKERYVITQVEPEETKIEAQRHRLGFRVQVSNIEVSRLSLSAAVSHYRGASCLEGGGFHRLKDRPLGIRPLYVQRDDQIVGLTRLLTLGLRVITILETEVRRCLAAAKETLAGLNVAQPKQETAQPTATRLLQAVVRSEITLTCVKIGAEEHWHLTPLPEILTRVLAFLGLSPTLYTQLTENSLYPREVLRE
jgi:transposase